MKKKPPEAPSLGDVAQRNVETVARLEQGAQSQLNGADRFTNTVTRFIGSLPFVALHLVWFAVWIDLNVRPPQERHFDPYPFNLLGLIVGLEAVCLSSFILITQNREQRLADRRAHLELQINLLAEQEATKILSMLEAIQKRLGIGDHDPEVAALKQATEPEMLLDQIEKQAGRPDQEATPS